MKKLLSIWVCLTLVLTLSGCTSAGSLNQDGKENFLAGNYEEAAADFSEAISENPNRADYYIDYGLALTKLERYEEALEEFDKAYVNKDNVVTNRNNKRVYRGKGIAYYYMQAYPKAIEEFNKALEIGELSDLNMDILYYVGSAQMMAGAYEDAVKTYTRLIDTDGKDAVAAYDNRALCCRILGDYESGLADYNKAISLEPEVYAHYFGKYDLLLEQGEDAAAGEVLAEASKLAVKTGEDQYNVAKLHYFQGDYDTALAEFNNGFANGFNEAYYYIGEICREKKDYPEAIYYYEAFIGAGKPVTPEVYNQLAVCLMKDGQYDKALGYLGQGIAYNQAGTLQTLRRNEVIACERLGSFEEANEKLAEYLKLYPEDEAAIKESEFIETRLIAAVIPEGE